MQLFSFCGIGGGMVACSACTVVILHPTLLALSFSDLLAVLTLEVCKTNPKIEDLAHQECKISKIKSQVFMTAPLKLHEGTRHFQFPIAFQRHQYREWSKYSFEASNL